MARELSTRLGCAHIELDAHFHQPGWTPAGLDEFRESVESATRVGTWVCCGNYRAVRDIVWSRADTVIVFDLPRRIVMARVLKRTFRRVVTREELWNGNREKLGRMLSLHDKEKSIIAWAWRQHSEYRRQHVAAMADPRWAHLRFIVLRHPRDATELIRVPQARDQ